MGNFKVYTTFNKNLGQTVPSAWKCPKTQFWGPPTNWKFEPAPRPTHTLTPPSINTQNRSKNYVLIYHDMHWTLSYKSKTLYHTEKQGFGYPGFQIKFKTHPPKLAEVEPRLRKVSLLPTKLRMLFPAHLWVREFWPQIYSLSQALDWGLLSAGPRMPKGQLSRVPWPGNSWMPFTFQPALQALQQPHKHSHTLQLLTLN